MDIIHLTRSVRKEYSVEGNATLEIFLTSSNPLIEAHREDLIKFCRANKLELVKEETISKLGLEKAAVRTLTDKSKVYIKIQTDPTLELKKLQKRFVELTKSLSTLQQQSSNPSYQVKVPMQLQEKNK